MLQLQGLSGLMFVRKDTKTGVLYTQVSTSVLITYMYLVQYFFCWLHVHATVAFH